MFDTSIELKDFCAAAAELVGPDNVKTGEDIGADYAHDEASGGSSCYPELVIEVDSTDKLSKVLALCCMNDVPVTLRGAGTGKAGGSVALNGGAVVSLKGMNKVLDYNANEKTIAVQAGVLLQDIKAAADKDGLLYPPDPGEKTATIGGNVATNAAGPSAMKYGTTKDYVLEMTAVKADGGVIECSDKSAINELVGSEGTLAAIAELKLRLVEKPAADVTLLLPFADIETCLNAVPVLQSSDLDISVMEFMDTDLVEFSGKVTGNPVFPVEMDGERTAATLMLTILGADDDALDEQMEAVAELAEDIGCLDILVVDSPTMKREAAAAYDAFHTSMESGAKHHTEVNVSVPVSGVSEMVTSAKNFGTESIRVMVHAHAASGGVHMFAVSDMAEEEFKAEADRFSKEMLTKCNELGGDIAGEYGVGYQKVDAFRACTDEGAYEKLMKLKDSFDPKHIMNPGKVVK